VTTDPNGTAYRAFKGSKTTAPIFREIVEKYFALPSR